MLLPPGESAIEKSQQQPVGITTEIPFSPLEREVESKVTAATADDAEVNLSQWALPNETEEQARARVVLRRLAAKWWRHYQEKLARKWVRSQIPSRADLNAMEDCIRRIRATTYWSWPRGSRLHFYKFPADWREDARDGVKFWHLSTPPKSYMRNIKSESREAELATRLKIFKLRYQWYLERGFTDCLVPRFSIVKVMIDGVVADIRVVWDCTANGHNDTLWVPSFMLPNFQDAADMVVKWLPMPVGDYLEQGSPVVDYTQDAGTFIPTFQGDIDVGSMFHNFLAHMTERHSLGVRYTETDPTAVLEHDIFLRFCRLNFGNKASPYLACQMQSRINEMSMKHPDDPKSAFQWERVYLNLPCDKGYDPSFPRAILLRKDNEMATRQATYVDDIRVAGRGRTATKLACRQLKSEMSSVGNQPSDKKYRQPSATSGAWKGEIIHTDTPFPMKSTTGKKWAKFKDGLQLVLAKSRDSGFIETSTLRRVAGLGVHITEVYSYGRCYLKGFFNAMEAFRDGRDLDGW